RSFSLSWDFRRCLIFDGGAAFVLIHRSGAEDAEVSRNGGMLVMVVCTRQSLPTDHGTSSPERTPGTPDIPAFIVRFHRSDHPTPCPSRLCGETLCILCVLCVLRGRTGTLTACAAETARRRRRVTQ